VSLLRISSCHLFVVESSKGTLLLALALLCLASACTSKCRTGTTLKDGRCIAVSSNAASSAPAAGTVAGQSATGTAGTSATAAQAVTAGAGASGIGNGPTLTNVAGGGPAPGSSPSTSSGSVAGSGGNTSPSCSPEGAVRCAESGSGDRESCVGGAWKPQAACAADELCMTGATETSCVKVERACVGFEGQVICDNDGLMLVCAADGSVTSSSKCSSRELCEAGIDAMSCALCVPATEHRCDGATLDVCAQDGQSFSRVMDCVSGPLCDAESGSCIDATCEAGTTTCQGNTLLKCNADATDYELMMPCGQGTCDAVGGDCNKCEPGTRTCEQNTVLTCDASGQDYTSQRCSGDRKCVDEGRCVECVADGDCSELSSEDGCKVGVCRNESCTTSNAILRSCVGQPGMCSGGRCVCNASCTGKCGGDDGCGDRCPDNCGNGQECQNDVCVSVGRRIYESCTPGSSMQGDCVAGHSCIGIGGRGPRCFQNAPCSIAQVTVFGMVCAQPCTPMEPNGPNSACPNAASFCFTNGETGTEDDGYCIP